MSAEELLRVIVADDDPFARRVIKGVLQAAGLIVVAEAKDGNEAVELAVYYRPDVVVMDVVMPRVDGILATRRILKQVPDQLVVVLTGSAEEELGLLALEAGGGRVPSKGAGLEGAPPPPGGGRSRVPLQGRRHRCAATRAGRRAPRRGRDLAPDDASSHRPVQRTRRIFGTATDQESPDRARMGGHRPPEARPIDPSGRGHARPLSRDGALPRQEHHAEAGGP